MATEHRDNHGQYSRSIDTAERDAECARLRANGLGVVEIAKRVGYANHSSVSKAISRAMMATVQEAGEEAKQLELARLDAWLAKGVEILNGTYYAHSQGRLIELHGQPLIDVMPNLQALGKLISLSESRRKLKGMDAPTRHEVITIDAIDAELQRLEAQHAELARRAEARQATGAEGGAGAQPSA